LEQHQKDSVPIIDRFMIPARPIFVLHR